MIGDDELFGEIASNGAVLLGRNVVCDAHFNRSIRIVTHAHSDHVLELSQSIKQCSYVFTTPTTRDLLSILCRIPSNTINRIRTLEYCKSIRYDDEEIKLYPSGHIIGSAQVLLKDSNGNRIVYTSDFKLPNAPIIPSDLLIIEATYGNPLNTRPFKEKVEDELVKLIKTHLRNNPVYVFGYHGKLQEVIKLLNDKGVNIPIVLSESVYKVAKVCEKHGMKIKNYLPIKSSEAIEIMKTKNYIAMFHMSSKKYIKGNATKIYLSGWEFKKPYRVIGEKEYIVALSDHSDFNQLLEYIKESKPKTVITDNYRVGDAEALAHEITRRLNINAKPMPLFKSKPTI